MRQTAARCRRRARESSQHPGIGQLTEGESPTGIASTILDVNLRLRGRGTCLVLETRLIFDRCGDVPQERSEVAPGAPLQLNRRDDQVDAEHEAPQPESLQRDIRRRPELEIGCKLPKLDADRPLEAIAAIARELALNCRSRLHPRSTAPPRRHPSRSALHSVPDAARPPREKTGTAARPARPAAAKTSAATRPIGSAAEREGELQSPPLRPCRIDPFVPARRSGAKASSAARARSRKRRCRARHRHGSHRTPESDCRRHSGSAAPAPATPFAAPNSWR